MNDQADTVRKADEPSRRLPVPCPPPGDTPKGGRSTVEISFVAQMLGAGGQRCGLKGGMPVLQAARRAYLGTEWSGEGDRRSSQGAVALKRI